MVAQLHINNNNNNSNNLLTANGLSPGGSGSFTAVSIIFVHPLYLLPSYIPWGD
jgi:hypothetical protein